jgi:N-acetyl-1-D-myo-inositol-2-amino-2-deoxy-alpha-D-glucopyranoside deacetylase
VSILDGVGCVLFVHAHPDDETISSGGLIAELTERGIRVVLATASLGEQGEVVPERAGTISAEPVALSRTRTRELQGALRILGVSESYLLGTPPARASGLAARRYRDSGMRWLKPGLAGPAADVPADALSIAPLTEVADDIAALISVVEPDLVISYDDSGGYGHPDHIRSRAAALLAASRAGIRFAELIDVQEIDVQEIDVQEEDVQRPDVEWFELSSRLPTVQEALRQHASQLTVVGDHIIHSGGQREPIRPSIGLREVAASVGED